VILIVILIPASRTAYRHRKQFKAEIKAEIKAGQSWSKLKFPQKQPPEAQGQTDSVK
jgi:hypothetical protein